VGSQRGQAVPSRTRSETRILVVHGESARRGAAAPRGDAAEGTHTTGAWGTGMGRSTRDQRARILHALRRTSIHPLHSSTRLLTRACFQATERTGVGSVKLPSRHSGRVSSRECESESDVAVLIAAAATDDGATQCQINVSGRRRSGAGRRSRRLKRWQHRRSRNYRADSVRSGPRN
jgi:hypothetical protein